MKNGETYNILEGTGLWSTLSTVFSEHASVSCSVVKVQRWGLRAPRTGNISGSRNRLIKMIVNKRKKSVSFHIFCTKHLLCLTTLCKTHHALSHSTNAEIVYYNFVTLVYRWPLLLITCKVREVHACIRKCVWQCIRTLICNKIGSIYKVTGR